jgi:hypothetical protein
MCKGQPARSPAKVAPGKTENRDHFSDSANTLRVQLWREEHPRYWCRKNEVLGYPITDELAQIVGQLALQDTIDSRIHLLIGIISHLSKDALQDTIAKEMRRLIMTGRGILEGIT